jgi:hypothetical protein
MNGKRTDESDTELVKYGCFWLSGSGVAHAA